MSKTEAVMEQAFYPGRPARSAAYKAGVRDVLLKRLDGVQDIPFPFRLGSAEADAYMSGTDEGRRRAAELLAPPAPISAVMQPAADEARDTPVYSSPGLSRDDANRRALELLRPFHGQPVAVIRQVLRRADQWLEAVTTLDCGRSTEFARAVEGCLLVALPRKIEAPATNEERIRQGLRPRAKNAAE